jgi:VanZ family protein
MIASALLIIVLLFKSKVWKNSGWLILIVITAIIFGVLCPNNYLEIVASNLNIDVSVMKKIGHLSMFLLLGTVSFHWLRHRFNANIKNTLALLHAVLLFMGLSLFAAMTEFLQVVTVDRNAFVAEWLLDLVGIVMGMLLSCFFMKIPKLRKTPFSETNGADPH